MLLACGPLKASENSYCAEVFFLHPIIPEARECMRRGLNPVASIADYGKPWCARELYGAWQGTKVNKGSYVLVTTKVDTLYKVCRVLETGPLESIVHCGDDIRQDYNQNLLQLYELSFEDS